MTAAALVAFAFTALGVYAHRTQQDLIQTRREVARLRRDVERLSRQHPAHPANTGAMNAPLMLHSRN